MGNIRRYRPGRPPRGFTLLEMVVVLVVVGLLLAVGLPRISQITTQQRVDRNALVVAGDLRLAFTEASRGRVPVRVAIAAAATKYALTNRLTGDTIMKRNFGSGMMQLSGQNGGAVTIDVFPNGVSSGETTITVAQSGYTRQVRVSRVGYVRVL